MADIVKLAAEGVEKLRTGPMFSLWIEDMEFQWPKPTITTKQIAETGDLGPVAGRSADRSGHERGPYAQAG